MTLTDRYNMVKKPQETLKNLVVKVEADISHKIPADRYRDLVIALSHYAFPGLIQEVVVEDSLTKLFHDAVAHDCIADCRESV